MKMDRTDGLDLRRFLGVLLAAALIAVAGCSSDDDVSGDAVGEQAAPGAGGEVPGEGREADGQARRGGEDPGGAGSAETDGDRSDEARAELRRHRREQALQNAPTPQEREAMDQVDDFYEILGEDSGDADSTDIDSASFCDLMSQRAIEQTIDYARRASGMDQEWNCENAIELLVLRSKRTGGFEQSRRARVVGVNIEGNRATATIRFGRGPISSIPMVREDGEWKLGVRPGAGGS